MKLTYDKLLDRISYIFMIVFSLMLYLILLLASQDNDMFFEIMSGRDLLNGNFSTVTHLDNFPMIIQQWLYAVVLAIFDNFGYAGHVACVLIQNIILIILSTIFIKLKSNHNTKTALSISFLALLFCSEYLINIRPQIITMILLMSQLIMLELYKKHNKIKYLAFIIPILILAANFHQAVFLYHILLLVPYYIDTTNKYYIDIKTLVMTPLYMICSLCTPYGIDGSLYIIRTFQSGVYNLQLINELSPITADSFVGIKLLLVVIATIILIYFRKSNKYLNIYIFGILILSMISVRHVSILYIPVIFMLCILNIKKFNVTKFRVSITVLCMSMTLLLANTAHDITYGYEQIETIIEDKDAKIYNSAMDVGGFLEYNGYTKIHIDSRCEAFSEEISGIKDINTNLYTTNTGYITTNNYDFATDQHILDIVSQYDYIVADRLDYINRVTERNDNWIKLYSSKSYTIWKHV